MSRALIDLRTGRSRGSWPRALRRGAVILLLAALARPAGAGEVELLSRADPNQGLTTPSGPANIAVVSADGRWVAFEDSAQDVVAGQSGPQVFNLFLHDRMTGATILVSRAAGSMTTGGDDDSGVPALSADGRYVYYASQATNLVAGQVDDPGTYDLFLFDRTTGATTLVSHAAGSPTTAADGPSFVLSFDTAAATVSADGRFAAFASSASDLVAGQTDTNGGRDVFLFDRTAGTTALASHAEGSATTAGGAVSRKPSLSADGRWLAFQSAAADLVAGRAGGVFLYDALSGAVSWVGPGVRPVISADGGWIAFLSSAGDVVPGQVDANGGTDVFLAERASGAVTLVSRSSASPLQTGNGFSGLPDVEQDDPTLSGDGRWVAFVSRATDLVPGQVDSNGAEDVFLFDRVAGATALVSGASTAPATRTGDDLSIDPHITPDGRFIAFFSGAENLVPGQVVIPDPFDRDVFLYDRTTGTKTLVSHRSGDLATPGNGHSFLARPSADGAWISFLSRASNLAAGVTDQNGAIDIYLFDRASGTSSLVSRRGGAAAVGAGGSIAQPLSSALSHDGRFIAFVSSGRLDSGAEDDNGLPDVFLFDRLTRGIALVSHESGGTRAAAGGSVEPLVSADGSTVVFQSSATNLVPGQVTAGSGLHLFRADRASGAVALVNRAGGTTAVTADRGAGSPSASGSGRFIAFTSAATNLVPGQVEGNSLLADVFFFDAATGTTTLVSRAGGSAATTANAASADPSISSAGRFLAFASAASDLVPGRAGGVFLYDRDTGLVTWIGPGSEPEISGDGRWVAFLSSATDVVPGQVDGNGGTDVFLWERATGATTLASRSVASATTAGNAPSVFTNKSGSPDVLSADGRSVVFAGAATDLVAGQTDANGASDVFLFDRTSGTTALVSRSTSSPLATANDESADPGISADGSHVAFRSRATDLVVGQVDTNNLNELPASNGMDVFVLRRTTGAIDLVTRSLASPVTAGGLTTTDLPRISADGASVVFSSPASDLVAGDLGSASDAFLFVNPLPGRSFFTLTPCRVLDTREPAGGPALASGALRVVLAAGACGIPATARALAVNVTVTEPTGAGHLTFHAGDVAAAATSTINFGPGQTRANNAVLPLAYDGGGTFAVTPAVVGGGTVHLIVDVNGYVE